MESRQRQSIKTELILVAQTAPCVLETPLASVDHVSVQLPDHDPSKIKSTTTECYSDQSSFPSQAVGFKSNVDPTKDSSESLSKYNHTDDSVKIAFSVKELKVLLAFCKACEAGESMAPNFNLDDGSISSFDTIVLLATKLVSLLQEAANDLGRVSLRKHLNTQTFDCDSTRLWIDLAKEFLKYTHSGEMFDDTSSLKLEHGDAKIGGGGKKKKQNPQAQSKKDIKARENAKPQQESESSDEEESIHEIYGREGTVTKTWTLEEGFVIDTVFDQGEDDICWAVVLVRMVQAIKNSGLPINQQTVFSIHELVDKVKPGEDKSLKLSNLKVAFDHIKNKGVMKKPDNGNKGEALGHRVKEALGLRVMKEFKLFKDVEASFVQAQVDELPVGLCLEITSDFENLEKEGIYILPEKREITPTSRLHIVLIVGYGFTEDEELYFIIQNSWGKKWSLNGFGRIIIKHRCDIISLK